MQPTFIRTATKRETANPTRVLASIPDREGFDKVYKPYGPDGERGGRGFYYIPCQGHTRGIPSKDIPSTYQGGDIPAETI